MTATLAVIGGSGLYSLFEDFIEIRKEIIATPYGEPSGSVVHGEMHGKPVVFIARHGYTHAIPPHKINYRANIWMLKELGIQQIIAVNAVGGISRDFPPKKIAIPDQIIDYSYGREFTFVDENSEEVIHVDFSYPFSETIRKNLIDAAEQLSIPVNKNGVYGCTQGPRLETVAEIKRLEQDGCTMVGMTAMPEAALAREKGIKYASLAVCANWAAGLEKETLSMDVILNNLSQGMQQVNQCISKYIYNL